MTFRTLLSTYCLGLVKAEYPQGSWFVANKRFSRLKAILFSIVLLGAWQQGFGQTNVTYFVPLPDQDVYTSLKVYTDARSTSISSSINSVISIVVAEDGAVIRYDHWEDGYEANLASPVQSTTQVWGDNNPANGIPPGYATDVLKCGSVIALENLVPIPRLASSILYDGKDKITSNRSLSISRSAWAPTPGTVLAGAVEVLDKSSQGVDFKVPVGQNTPGSVSMFERTELYIMAFDNATTVQVDADANGSFELTQTLAMGENYRVPGGVLQGARVLSNKNVQVHIITGDIGAGYESRWFTLFPSANWGKVYYSPVSTTNVNAKAVIFLFNPGGSSLTVTATTSSGNTPITVPANGTAKFVMPQNSGALFAAGSSFFAVETIDSDNTDSGNQTYDWGFTLLPESYLSQSVAVGWGPGSSNLSANGSPIWVMSRVATTIYVDLDGDPLTGPLTDPNGQKYNYTVALTPYQSYRIYDNTDNDQTGMRIYTLDGNKIAAAWGQDPSVAGPGNPFLDMGTTIPPALVLNAFKTAGITTDTDSDGKVDPNDVITYRIIVSNRALYDALTITVADTLPTQLQYVSGSMIRKSSVPANNGPVADSGSTPFPLDEGGKVFGTFLANQVDTLEFKVTALGPVVGLSQVINTARIITADGRSYSPSAVLPVDNSFTGCVIDFTNSTFAATAASYQINSTAYIKLTAAYLNTSNAVQTVQVTLKNNTNGDSETITLTETTGTSGIFTASLPTSTSAGDALNDGTLKALTGHTITVTHTNSFYNDVCSKTVTITPPTFTKPLYLSTDGVGSPDQDLDRIHPGLVSPVDATTATSQQLGSGGGTVAFGAQSSASTTSGTTLAWSHVVGSGTNRILMVGITIGGNSTTGAVSTVTSVTYGSQALTLVPNTAISAANAEIRTEIWYLLAPNTGTNTITVTLPAGARSITGGGVSYTGVDQTTPFGTAASATGVGTTASLGVTSAVGQRVLSVVGFDSSPTLTATSPQTSRWNIIVDAAACNCNSGAGSDQAGAAGTVTSSYTSSENQDYTIAAVPIRPAPAGVATTTFTQIPVMCGPLSLPNGATVGATLYTSIVSGTMPANPNITAVLKHGTTTFATLTNPTYNSGTGILTFTNALGSAVTIPASSAVSLEVTTAQAGVSFTILSDSQTNPSRIDLPATTVISVNSLAVYNAPYPGGSIVTGDLSGQTVYVRSVVSDPFGFNDITSQSLAITNPGNATNTFTTAQVATAGCTKTFEYAWTLPSTIGNYKLEVTAKEGYENNVVDKASTNFEAQQLDLGTPCMSDFTNGAFAPVTSYVANGTIYIKISDPDQDLTTGLDVIQVVITTSTGDTETITLTETGNTTGIFQGSIPSNTLASTTNNGTLNAPEGAQLTLMYTDPTDGSDVCTDQAIISTPTPAVTLTKTLITPSNGIANVGEVVQYRIVISNTGTTNINQLTLTDTFDPTFLQYDSASVAPNASASGSRTWTSSIVPIAAGTFKTINVYFKALAAVNPTNNTATTTNGLDQNSTAIPDKNVSAPVVITRPALTITKTRTSSATATIGSPVTYTITLTNTGTSNITSLPLADLYSDFCLTFVSASIPPNSTGGGTLNWTNLASTPLAPNDVVTITLNFLAKNQCTPATNTAKVEFATDVNGDPIPPVQSSATVDITENPKIGVAKNLTSIVNNLDGTYTVTMLLTLENFGDVPLSNLTLFDDIPNQFTGATPITNYNATDGTLTANTGWDGTASSNILATGQSLTVGATGTVSISFKITPPGITTYNNNASVSGTSPIDAVATDISTDGLDPDGTTSDNNPNESVPTPVLVPGADLAITKTDSSTTYTPGDSITYTITVTNNGPSNVTGATVTDTIPNAITGVTWTSTTAGTASVTSGATGSGNTLSATININSGAGNSVTFSVTGTVSQLITASLTNTATVSTPSGVTDPTPGNNSATDTDSANPVADLGVQKLVDNATPVVNSNVVFTIKVINNGPSDATGVVVNDLLPSGYQYVLDNGGGAYNDGTGLWTIGSLLAGGTDSLKITAKVNSTGNYQNISSIAGNESDPVTSNDTSKVATTPAIAIVASYDNLGTVASGSELTKPLLVNDTLNGVGNFDPTLVNITVTDTPTKGVATINPTTGEVTYTPTAGTSGVDSLIYQICDKLNPAVCDTALVVVTITPVIDAVRDVAGTVASGGSLTYPLLTNDTLNRVGNFDPTLVTITTLDSASKGTASINPTTGEVTYTPTAGASGVDSLHYQICDKLNPTVCDSAWAVFTITPVIDAVRDVAGTVASGGSLTYPLLANDTLNRVGNFDPTLVTISTLDSASKGTASINPATGIVTYTPTPGFSGADSLHYQICDQLNPTVCDSAWAVFTITPVIVASYDNLGTLVADSSITYAILLNDSLNRVSPIDTSLVTVSLTQNGSRGVGSLNPDGTLTYVAGSGQAGLDSLIYQICDKLNPAVCDTALVVVRIESPLLLRARVYLQGALFGVTYSDAPTNTQLDSLMRDDLRVKGLLPLTSPYSSWSPTIAANTITAPVLTATGRDAIVDWVFVELREATDSTRIVTSRAALVQRDGDIVSLDGSSPLEVRALEGTAYYVSVRHRNHLGVMTASAVPMSAAGTLVDFRQPGTATYVLGVQPIHQAQVSVLQGRALWAGNALADSTVIYQGTLNDVNVVAQQVVMAVGNSFTLPFYILKGYYGGDINLNGEVIFQGTGNDVEYIYQNVIKNHPGNAFKDDFFIIQQQLPK